MLKIRKIQVPTTVVYDISVPDTESFFANNVLVHNCNEIHLVTDENRTAVCCLSSVNAEYFDEWKNDKLFLKDVAEMLDNVLQKFIDDAPDTISRARFSAMRERSIGVGLLGLHSYFQKHMIPFESAMATGANIRIFKHIRTQLDIANAELGAERGSNLDYIEANGLNAPQRRFTHVMACAPNASSSILMGNCSPSIEPYKANVYRQDTLSGAYTNRNRYLDKIIKAHCEQTGDDYDDVWRDILANEGSVQHIKWMDQNTKDVFKTALEIDQMWIIDHAAKRQEFIDQGQSVNTFFAPDVNVKYLHAVHFMAWKQGLKGLYYCRSEKLGKASKLSTKVQREKIEDMNMISLIDNSCSSCEG
jgi:ribonucleoside-diphosphate reductase alpha chain